MNSPIVSVGLATNFSVNYLSFQLKAPATHCENEDLTAPDAGIRMLDAMQIPKPALARLSFAWRQSSSLCFSSRACRRDTSTSVPSFNINSRPSFTHGSMRAM